MVLNCCAYTLVRFRHKTLSWVRKTSCFCIKYLSDCPKHGRLFDFPQKYPCGFTVTVQESGDNGIDDNHDPKKLNTDNTP